MDVSVLSIEAALSSLRWSKIRQVIRKKRSIGESLLVDW